MNAQRRKAIRELAEKIGAIADDLRFLAEDIETFLEEEQDAYDNLPESFQCSERGEKMQAYIDVIDSFQSAVADACDILEEACGEIEFEIE